MLHYKVPYYYFHGIIINLFKKTMWKYYKQIMTHTMTGTQECSSSLTSTNKLRLFCPLLFPYNGKLMQALSYAYKIDQTDFTDWMFFLPANFMEEITRNTEASRPNT